MLSYEEMPDDNAELSKVSVSFPDCEGVGEQDSPASMDDILDYLSRESADYDDVRNAQLKFLRTAVVGDSNYWIWELYESDGAHCYVTVSRNVDGQVCIGYDENWAKLTPEQFLLGDYHNVF